MATYNMRFISEMGEVETSAEGKSPKNAVYWEAARLEGSGEISIPCDVEWEGPNGSGTMNLVHSSSVPKPSTKDMPIEFWASGEHIETGKRLYFRDSFPADLKPNDIYKNEVVPFLLEQGFVGKVKVYRVGPQGGQHGGSWKEITPADHGW